MGLSVILKHLLDLPVPCYSKGWRNAAVWPLPPAQPWITATQGVTALYFSVAILFHPLHLLLPRCARDLWNAVYSHLPQWTAWGRKRDLAALCSYKEFIKHKRVQGFDLSQRFSPVLSFKLRAERRLTIVSAQPQHFVFLIFLLLFLFHFCFGCY